MPLLQRAVGLVTPPGGIVGDPFAGIATAGVAALAEGRRFIGGEIDRRHWQLGRRRLIEAGK